jgi:hypothetical protein
MEAKPPLRFRKLRVAWSVAWGIVAVLLVALWVRSYQTHDIVTIRINDSGPQFLNIHSTGGHFSLVVKVHQGDSGPWLRHSASSPPLNAGYPDDFGNYPDSVRFRIFRWRSAGLTQVQIPIWFPVVLFALLVVVPWIRQVSWRFSLRTLLVATTLVAVGLGLLLWATK